MSRWLIALVLVGACGGDDGHVVLVNLRTDWVPGIEFVTVRTTLSRAGGDGEVLRTAEDDVAVGRDAIEGIRIAELDGLGSGTYRVVVELLATGGPIIDRRPTLIEVRGNLGFTVVMTRSCEGVTCPGAGDPALSACLDARCVDPGCTPETPERCPVPVCTADDGCTVAAACAAGTCRDGSCLATPVDGACMADEWCDPATGCRARTDVPDAGPAPTDAGGGGSDAGGPTDGGDVDAGGATDAGGGPCAFLGDCETVAAMQSGNDHTCAMLSDGRITCWGNNMGGQLGDMTRMPRASPVFVAAVRDAMDLGVGNSGSCYVAADRRVLCWNLLGASERTGLPPATDVEYGNDHACVLSTGGEVWCWGDNSRGQLGDGTATMGRSTPAPVSGLPAAASALGVGDNHACVRVSGSLHCWGSNSRGELGRGNATPSENTPAIAAAAGMPTTTTAGLLFTCGIYGAGQVRCWGANGRGQAGDGTTKFGMGRLTPSDTGITDAIFAYAQESGVCAVRAGGAVLCWGQTPTAFDTATPMALANVVDARLVAGGDRMVCVVENAGRVKCAGANERNQIGDGTTTPRPMLVPVLAPP